MLYVYKDMISTLMFLVAVVISTVLAAPVTQNKNLESLTSQIRDQEHALETLATQSQKGMPQNIQLARTFAYSNMNGAENSRNKIEEKVLDPVKGVTSDLKEKLTESKASPDSPVEKAFKGSLDVPALGIHKEVTNSGESAEQDEDNRDLKDTVEFTPQAVAEYLARTGEIDEFKELLNELVEAQEITSEDAESYEKSVMDEYFKLMQDTPSNKAMGEDKPAYIPANKQSLYPGFNDADQNEVFPLYGYGQDTEKAAEDARMDMYINYLMNRPVTLDEMISSLMDEWLTRAIISGDPEAEEILSNIVDYVTRDDNPNDEEQVREILGDIFAEALLEDLTPRIEPQSVPEVPLAAQTETSEDNSAEPVLTEPVDEQEVRESEIPEKKSDNTDDLVQTANEQEEGEGRPKN